MKKLLVCVRLLVLLCGCDAGKNFPVDPEVLSSQPEMAPEMQGIPASPQARARTIRAGMESKPSKTASHPAISLAAWASSRKA